MHILDDPTNSARVARFLAAHGERWASPEAEDHWMLRCFARAGQHLPDVLRRVDRLGPIDSWCSVCCRFLQPSLPKYTPQGDPGYCIPPAPAPLRGSC